MLRRQNVRWKRRRRDGPYDQTKHHRKPVTLGGVDQTSNISMVPRRYHEAWHVLFNHLSAESIVRELNLFFVLFGLDPNDAEQAKFARTWVKRKKSRKRICEAWFILFAHMSKEKMLRKINEVWIDPAYRIVPNANQHNFMYPFVCRKKEQKEGLPVFNQSLQAA